MHLFTNSENNTIIEGQPSSAYLIDTESRIMVTAHIMKVHQFFDARLSVKTNTDKMALGFSKLENTMSDKVFLTPRLASYSFEHTHAIYNYKNSGFSAFLKQKYQIHWYLRCYA